MAVTPGLSQGSAVFAPFSAFCAEMSGKNCAHAAAWALFVMQLWILVMIGIVGWIIYMERMPEENRAAERRGHEGN